MQIISFDSTGRRYLGNFIVMPGFNQNPDAMGPLISFLRGQGYRIHFFLLPDDAPADPEIYYNFLKSSAEQVFKEKQKTYFLGYSFGGFWGKVLDCEFNFESMIYFAPALFLRKHCYLLKRLLPMLPVVPSLPLGDEKWEEKYRRNKGGVPREQYLFLYNSLSRYEPCLKVQVSKLLLFANPKDELVSYSKVKKWARKFPDNCEMLELRPVNPKLKRFQHLIIDETTLGEQVFEQTKAKIAEFIF